MRKLLLSILTLFAAVSSQAAIGDDLTANYLKNADFSQGTTVNNGITTYDYDMDKNGTTYYGQQEVEGWTAPTLTDNILVEGRTDERNARAAGLFVIGMSEEGDPYLGGSAYVAPVEGSTGDTNGNVLGLLSVWGAKLQYTQAVKLPAGCYTITIPTYNAMGSGSITANLFGFITDAGKAYTCDMLAFTEYDTWFDQTVTFILEEETSGVISVGYQGPSGSGSMPHLFIDCVKIEEGDPDIILGPMIEAAKEQLLALLEDGDELGVNTKAGWAVYNNDNATLEEVNAAIATQKENNEKGMTDFTDYFINNAHFSEGNPLDNGVCTYAKDMEANETNYFGMQPIPYWTASDPGTDAKASGLFAVGSGETAWMGSKNQGYVAPETKANGSTEGNVFGFVSCWGAAASYTQRVTLPAGSYTINIPTYNAMGGTTAVAKNLCGFIADDGTEYLAETKTFPVNIWSNEVIKFTLDEDTPGVISIGYTAASTGSGNMPHLFVDEFLLKYNGTIEKSPSLLALEGAIRTAEDNTDLLCEAALMTALNEAYDEAQALVKANSADDEANTAAATKLNNAVAEVKASAAVYEKFNDFLEGELAETIEKYTEGELSDFAVELVDTKDAYIEKYEAGEYTTAEINEIMSGLKPAVAEAIKSALVAAAADGQEHNLDISALFTNIDYANSTVEGWQNETGTTAFLSRVQTAEVWNQSNFNVYQTLADMPAGAYEISAPGFYRTAANTDNYIAWVDKAVEGSAYIYAGGNKVLMHNVAEYAADKDDNHTAETEGGFVPNSNANANFIFYTEGEAVNTLTTALVEGGDLTIGVKGENLSGNAWVVWGGFTVTYKGAGESLILAALDGQIDALITDAQNLSKDDVISTVVKSYDGLNNAVDAGTAAIQASDRETKQAAIAGLQDAIAYAKKSTPLLEKLLTVFNLYSTLRENAEFETTDVELDKLLDDEIEDPQNGAPSNEKIEEWIEAMPLAWTKYVCGQPEMKSASEAAPVDLTAAILNAGFEGVTSETAHTEFWAVTKDGGNEGYQYGVYEFYNNNSCDIHQDIEGLTPGYYRVKVQSFYRAGDNNVNAASLLNTPDSINHGQLYANLQEVNLKNVLDIIDNEDEGFVAGEGVGVGGEVTVVWKDSTDFIVPNNREALEAYFGLGQYWNQVDCQVTEDGKLTLGIKKEAHVTNDWLPYDNFQLYYLGTTAPTAVKAVEAEVATAKAGIYDLQGRKVSKAQKGLYIVNGKVVLMK